MKKNEYSFIILLPLLYLLIIGICLLYSSIFPNANIGTQYLLFIITLVNFPGILIRTGNIQNIEIIASIDTIPIIIFSTLFYIIFGFIIDTFRNSEKNKKYPITYVKTVKGKILLLLMVIAILLFKFLFAGLWNHYFGILIFGYGLIYIVEPAIFKVFYNFIKLITPSFIIPDTSTIEANGRKFGLFLVFVSGVIIILSNI